MDQGVTTTFKMYYLRWTLFWVLDATDGPDNPSICDYWQEYNILHTIKNIRSAKDKPKTSIINGVRKVVCKESIHDFKGSVTPTSEVACIFDLG